MASLPRKRVILGQLFEKIEVGKGYEVTAHINMSYQQFINLGETDEIRQITQANVAGEEVA